MLPSTQSSAIFPSTSMEISSNTSSSPLRERDQNEWQFHLGGYLFLIVDDMTEWQWSEPINYRMPNTCLGNILSRAFQHFGPNLPKARLSGGGQRQHLTMTQSSPSALAVWFEIDFNRS